VGDRSVDWLATTSGLPAACDLLEGTRVSLGRRMNSISRKRPDVLMTETAMQRFLILVLVCGVVGTGLTTCPQPAKACAMSVQARHACCDGATLRAARCCCAGGQRTARLVSTAGPLQQEHGTHSLVAVVSWQPSVIDAAALIAHRTRATHGPGPPDTPIHKHTQLLL
jgi:hypothetical protein